MVQQKNRRKRTGLDATSSEISCPYLHHPHYFSRQCQWGNWRMETTSLGLCSWNGTPFWICCNNGCSICPLV